MLDEPVQEQEQEQDGAIQRRGNAKSEVSSSFAVSSLTVSILHRDLGSGEVHPVQVPSRVSATELAVGVASGRTQVAEDGVPEGPEGQQEGCSDHPAASQRCLRVVSECQVSLCGGRLLISAGVQSYEVRLLLAELGHFYSREEQRHVIALMPSTQGCDEDPQADRQAWIFDVQNCGLGMAHQALLLLGSLGACRWDLSSVYHASLKDSFIGEGSCSQVYRASATKAYADICGMGPRFCSDVAVKILRPPINRGKMATLLKGEVGFLSLAQRHPNIIGFIGVFALPENLEEHPWWKTTYDEQDGAESTPTSGASSPSLAKQSRRSLPRHAIVMEHCLGGDLFDKICKGTGPYPQASACRLASGLVSALVHIHDRRIVHRDVKVENILIGEGGRPVLTDFGIAASLDDPIEMQRRCGSPGYVAPEVLSGDSYTEKIDLFSAGAVLYFTLSATLPFSGPRGSDTTEVLRRTLRGQATFDGNVHFKRVAWQVKGFITRLLHKMDQRPSAREALHELSYLERCQEPFSQQPIDKGMSGLRFISRRAGRPSRPAGAVCAEGANLEETESASVGGKSVERSSVDSRSDLEKDEKPCAPYPIVPRRPAGAAPARHCRRFNKSEDVFRSAEGSSQLGASERLPEGETPAPLPSFMPGTPQRALPHAFEYSEGSGLAMRRRRFKPLHQLQQMSQQVSSEDTTSEQFRQGGPDNGVASSSREWMSWQSARFSDLRASSKQSTATPGNRSILSQSSRDEERSSLDTGALEDTLEDTFEDTTSELDCLDTDVAPHAAPGLQLPSHLRVQAPQAAICQNQAPVLPSQIAVICGRAVSSSIGVACRRLGLLDPAECALLPKGGPGSSAPSVEIPRARRIPSSPVVGAFGVYGIKADRAAMHHSW